VFFSIGTPGATYTVTGPDGFTDSGTVGSNSIVGPPVGYPAGNYSITFSYQGATSATQSFQVGPGIGNTYAFPPVPVTDPGTTGGAAATTTVSGAAASATSANPTGPTSAAASASTSVVVPGQDAASSYPFSWPAYNYGKYFTPTQAFMYIGGLYIDELTGFQYTLQSNRVPVFGYSSRKMDAVGKGKSLVQGQFSINFISEGYLYTALNEYVQATANPQAADEQAALNIVQQLNSLQSSSSADASQDQIAALKLQLNQLLAKNSNIPSVISNSQNAGDVDYDPTNISTPFDIVMSFEGGGRTVTRTIKGCVLTSNEQVLGDNDTPILDAYGFIARSIQ
jgi:hypothetical protein